MLLAGKCASLGEITRIDVFSSRGKLQIAIELLNAGADIHAPVREGDYWVPPPAPLKPEVRLQVIEGRRTLTNPCL